MVYGFGSKKEIVTPDEISRENTRYLLNRTEVLILTVGLSEIWFDKDSGRAFWRAIPAKDYDESRHGFRLTSVEENFKNLQNIMLLRDQYLTNMKVIITLSPIPLMATFREVNCISANSTSKAILRVAIDLMMSEKHKQLYYFPSYELFKEVYVNPFQADNRHPREELVLNTMKLFERVYCN